MKRIGRRRERRHPACGSPASLPGFSLRQVCGQGCPRSARRMRALLREIGGGASCFLMKTRSVRQSLTAMCCAKGAAPRRACFRPSALIRGQINSVFPAGRLFQSSCGCDIMGVPDKCLPFRSFAPLRLILANHRPAQPRSSVEHAWLIRLLVRSQGCGSKECGNDIPLKGRVYAY